MQKMCFHIAFIVLLLANSIFYAQKDSLHLLQPIDVVQLKNETAEIGYNVYKPDSLFLKNNLSLSQAEFLFKSNVAYVKSYGSGNISSISIRGGSAQQTQVLWNGLNINNAMLGQADLSLLTTLPNQEFYLLRNGSSSAFGSGAVAGTILVNQPLSFNKGIHFTGLYSYSTTHDQRILLSSSISKKTFAAEVLYTRAESFNRFQYQSEITNSLNNNYNAYSEQQGLSVNLKCQMNEKSTILVHSWYQKAKRFLPDYILPTRKENSQNDHTLRFSAQIIRKLKKTELHFQQGLLNDEILYINPLLNIESNSQVQTWITQAHLPFTLRSVHKLQIGFSNYFSRAISASLDKDANQNRAALVLQYSSSAFGQYLQPNFNIRQEFVSTGENPLSGTIGIRSSIHKNLKLFAHIARLYRVPTINDLYWNPGGNNKLLSEKGWSAEGGLEIHYKHGAFDAQLTSSYYYRDVSNWIGWQPGSMGFWQAVNFGRVLTRGAETDLNLRFQFKKILIQAQGFCQYNLTTNAQKKSDQDESFDRQVIYSPLYSSSGRISIGFYNFLLVYGHNYTGYRYTSSDNYQYIKPFDYAYVETSYSVFLKNGLEAKLFVHINNLYNENYQLVKNYPQPGRNYRFGTMINF